MSNRDFVELGKQFVCEYMNLNYFDGSEEWQINEDDIYCVWLCKVLQNNKGLFSTDRLSGLYFEFTWNGDEKEGYLDVYKKQKNVVVRGEE